MKLVPLIWKNALRNKRRTVLTMGSLVTALVVFVFLDTLISSWAATTDTPDSARRLIVRHKVSLANVLPEKHAERIRRVPGVEIVHPYHWFGGQIKDKQTFFQQFACDDDTFFDMWTDVQPTRDHAKPGFEADLLKKAWKEDKQAAIVGWKTAERMGWKIGDRFTLNSAIYRVELEFRMIGTYTGFSDDDTIFFRRSYLQESLGSRKGVVGTFMIKVKDPAFAAAVIKGIDSEFANSDAPTRTETEKAFLLGFVSMMGNVKGFFGLLSAAVVTAMLFIMINTMAMAVRERTREIAIMKAIGFTPGSILFLVVAESIGTCLFAGVFACVGFRVLFENVLHRPNVIIFPNFCPPWTTVGSGLAIAFAMGMISGLLPALRAARLEVVSGLRRVG